MLPSKHEYDVAVASTGLQDVQAVTVDWVEPSPVHIDPTAKTYTLLDGGRVAYIEGKATTSLKRRIDAKAAGYVAVDATGRPVVDCIAVDIDKVHSETDQLVHVSLGKRNPFDHTIYRLNKTCVKLTEGVVVIPLWYAEQLLKRVKPENGYEWIHFAKFKGRTDRAWQVEFEDGYKHWFPRSRVRMFKATKRLRCESWLADKYREEHDTYRRENGLNVDPKQGALI